MATSFAFLDKPAKGLTAAQGPKPKPATSPRGFLDLSNPWAVPGVTAPAKQTPAKTAAKPKAPAPTRGYNYTESNTASGQPAYVRRQEVDQATMSGQAAGQRRAAARAQPQPVQQPAPPLKVQAKEMPPMPDPAGTFPPPPDFSNPATVQRWAPAASTQPRSPLSRAAAAWLNFAAPPPPAQASPLATPAAPAAGAAPAVPPASPAISATPAAPAAPPVAAPTPGPLTVDRRAMVETNLQSGQRMPSVSARPAYTSAGMRALVSENELAAEDMRRQRDAAGGYDALMRSGQYRPWSTLSPAEKQQRRFAPHQADAAESTRLAPVRQQAIGAYTEQRYEQIGWRPSAPAPAPTANAAAATATATAEQPQADLMTTARTLASRYLTGLDTSEMALNDLVYLLSKYNAPAHLRAAYNRDMRLLIEQLPKE